MRTSPHIDRFRLGLALAASILNSPCSRAAQFEDVTAAAGLTSSSAYCFAAAWGDYNGDGFPDLFIAAGRAGTRTNFLYLNAGNGSFTHVGPEAGPIVTDRRESFGCAWVDFDNNGKRDLLLINGPWGTARNELYWNQGGGRFSRGNAGSLTGWSMYRGWPACADADGDGYVDVFITDATGTSGPFTPRLYRNTGHGSFTPVEIGPSIPMCNDAAWGDFDNDGDPDLFACNFTSPSVLWRNDGHGQFTEMDNGLPANLGTWHAAWADYDHDGDLDIALGSGSNTEVYRNDGIDGFVYAAPLDGAISTPTWADYDNDGHPDLLAAAGQNSPMKAVLHHNNGDGTFTRVEDAMSGSLQTWMGTAWADFDNDGGMDVVFLHTAGQNRLYRNLKNANHWLKFTLTGIVSNRDAIGAKVRVLATIGGQAVWQLQEINGGYQVQHDSRAHFGLGDATNVDLVRIEWPSGNVQELADVAADQIVSVTEAVPFNPKRPSVSVNGAISLTHSGTAVSRQWRFEGVDLPGQTSGRLSLTNVTAAQEGRYSHVLDTGTEMVTNHTYLMVDPQFTKITEGPVVTDKVVSWSGHFGDYDSDGRLDLVVTGDYWANGRNTRLYHNEGQGQFSAVLTGPWENLTDRVLYGPWADADNDGDLDLLFGVHESVYPFYIRNDGAGAFTRLPVDRTWIQPPRQVTGGESAWADLDGDGLLDVILNGYSTFPLHNQGDGTFTVLTNTPMARFGEWSQAIEFVDYDNDGDLDVFLPAEVSTSRLYRNEGQGQFTDVSALVLQGRVGNGAGGAWADFDNDGDADLYFQRGNQGGDFLVNNGDGTFTDWSGGPAALTQASGSWGIPAWGDYDNDGWLDLLVTQYNGNGRLFRNQGEGNFIEVTTGSPIREPGTVKSAAWADYDDDGALDLFLARFAAAGNQLYQNNGNGHHWLKIRLKGTASNSHAIGARVFARALIDGRWVRQMRTISAGSVIQELEAHFGLGNAPRVATLRIEWPSGTVQELPNVAPDQILTLWEPPVLNAAMQAEGSCRITARAEPNRPWQIQASNDLLAWETLATVTPATVGFEHTDAAGAAVMRRFYRLLGE